MTGILLLGARGICAGAIYLHGSIIVGSTMYYGQLGRGFLTLYCGELKEYFRDLKF